MARDRRFSGRIVAGVGFALFIWVGWIFSQQGRPPSGETTLQGLVIEQIHEDSRLCTGPLVDRAFEGRIRVIGAAQSSSDVTTGQDGRFTVQGYPGPFSIRIVTAYTGESNAGLRTEPPSATLGDDAAPTFTFMRACKPPP